MSNDCKLEEKLLDLILGELQSDEKERIRAHIDTCSECKRTYSDLKIGVEKFHAAYPELPNAPKKLSQKRYEEILQIAKELEGECPDTWSRTPPSPTSDDESTRIGTWLAIAAAAILAVGLVMIVLNPWNASPDHMVKNPKGSPQPMNDGFETGNDPGTAPNDGGGTRKPAVVTVNDGKKPNGTTTDNSTKSDGNGKLRDGTSNNYGTDRQENRGTDGGTGTKNGSKTVATTTNGDNGVRVNQDDQTIAQNRRFFNKVTIIEIQRNQIPQRLETRRNGSDQGFSFTPMGHVLRVRKNDLVSITRVEPSKAPDAIVDDRPFYRLNYRTDEASANRLIDFNEKLLLAGGQGAHGIRFKPVKKEVEIIGNRQELNMLHSIQNFIANPTVRRVNSRDHETLRHATAPKPPENDEAAVKNLSDLKLKRSYTATRVTFSQAMKKLAEYGRCKLVDNSDQSKSRIHVEFDNVSVLEAINQLCKAVDVKPHFADGIITLSAKSFTPRMATTIVRVSPKAYEELLKRNKAPHLAAVLTKNEIARPKGSGVGIVNSKDAIIIHHYAGATLQILTIIKSCTPKEEEIK